jgi:putative ABC transport system permease protein
MEMPYFQLPYSQVCLSALLILINGAISVFLTFGLERRLPLAAVASVAQLRLIGLVFDRFLRPNRCEFVLALMAALTLIAGTAAVRRTDIR